MRRACCYSESFYRVWLLVVSKRLARSFIFTHNSIDSLNYARILVDQGSLKRRLNGRKKLKGEAFAFDMMIILIRKKKKKTEWKQKKCTMNK